MVVPADTETCSMPESPAEVEKEVPVMEPTLVAATRLAKSIPEPEPFATPVMLPMLDAEVAVRSAIPPVSPVPVMLPRVAAPVAVTLRPLIPVPRADVPPMLPIVLATKRVDDPIPVPVVAEPVTLVMAVAALAWRPVIPFT